MGILVLDFETHDPDLTIKGCGNVFGTLNIIGMGYKVDDGPTQYTQDKQIMKYLLEKHDTWIAHRIIYELNCAHSLGVSFKDKQLFCTLIGSILDKNVRFSHSLDYLAKHLLKKNKDQARLGRYVIDNAIEIDGKILQYPTEKHKTTEADRIKQATTLAMKNLHIINKHCPEIIEEYCKSDVELTYALHEIFKNRLDNNLYMKYSNVNKVTTQMRIDGVRIDQDALDSLESKLDTMIEDKVRILHAYNDGINPNSPKQVAELFDALGVEYKTNEETGNPKLGKAELDNIDHPVANLIKDIRKFNKFKNDFILKFKDLVVNGRLHGEMIVLGAKFTGRFSHTNPNLGNIPKRDPELGPLMRKLFLPEEGEQWFSMDFSSQEPRLMVHYAKLCQDAKVQYKPDIWDRDKEQFVLGKNFQTFNATNIEGLVEEYRKNPALDSHGYNRDIIQAVTGVFTGVDPKKSRSQTKDIALGKAYSMGGKKLAARLGLELNLAYDLLRAFDEGSPHLKELDNFIKYKMKTNKYIKTISGRVSHSDGVDYKALNKLIQGSAADQTAFAALELYEKYGIVPKTIVHDEINVSGSIETARIVKHVMETIYTLQIPSLTEIKGGSSWGSLETME